MKRPPRLSRMLTLLLLLCWPSDSSSLPTNPGPSQSVSRVGRQVVLPCDWRSHLQVAPASCHLEWQNLTDTVLEQRGTRRYQAPEFQERLEVPDERLRLGDCSLIIHDVQIADAGSYWSYVVVDGAAVAERTRVFIHSVRLLVHDHKSQLVRAPGEDMELQLYTRHSDRLIFQSRNSSQWIILWMREGGGEQDQVQQQQRVVKDPFEEQLTIKGVMGEDEGTYKVLDRQGLAISTVILSVQAKSVGVEGEREAMVSPGSAASSSSSSRRSQLHLWLLAAALQVLLLLHHLLHL